MKIKICGLTRPEEANYINDNHVDYAGFVFYEPSKRNLSIPQAEDIMKCLNADVKKVAVLVSPDVDMIEKLQQLPFDVLQIHKNLSEEVLRAAKLPVWYAINVADEDEALKKKQYIDELPDNLADKIEAVVVDAPVFGSGQTFNWRKSRRLLKAGAQSPPGNAEADETINQSSAEADGNDDSEMTQSSFFEGKKFVLAGGLNPENVKEGIEIFNPDIVDVSSGVEGSSGKDEAKIKAFVNAVRGNA